MAFMGFKIMDCIVFNSLVMCFDYSTAQGTVNGGASVKLSQILHLTASGGGCEGGLGREEKKF